MGKPTPSPRFKAPDYTLSVVSSDKVLFLVHRANFQIHSADLGTLVAKMIPDKDEPLDLEETAPVLDVLFQYMYPQPPPDLTTLDSAVLFGVADAAEKYHLYSAIPALRGQIKSMIPPKTVEDYLRVLNYGMRYNWADAVAPSVVQRCLAPGYELTYCSYHVRVAGDIC